MSPTPKKGNKEKRSSVFGRAAAAAARMPKKRCKNERKKSNNSERQRPVEFVVSHLIVLIVFLAFRCNLCCFSGCLGSGLFMQGERESKCESEGKRKGERRECANCCLQKQQVTCSGVRRGSACCGRQIATISWNSKYEISASNKRGFQLATA